MRYADDAKDPTFFTSLRKNFNKNFASKVRAVKVLTVKTCNGSKVASILVTQVKFFIHGSFFSAHH